MNYIISSKQQRLKILFLLLAGIFFATALWSQEPVVHSSDGESNEPGIHRAQPLFETISDDIGSGALDCQVVITHHTLGRVEPVCVRPEDEVWLISARQSHCAPSDLSLLQCSRLRNENWETAELDELVRSHSTDKTKVTMLYAHGNRTNLKWAKSRGLQFYQTAFQSVNRPPVRLVIFAWRSEREKARAISDYRIKSQRSVVIGETLGTLLCRFEDRQIVLGGFSLGAQIVFSALSMPDLQNQVDRIGKYRIAVFAPVLNPDFVQSGLMSFPNNPIVHRTDVFLNQTDRAVKFSQLVDGIRTKSKFSLRALANRNVINTGETAGNSIMIRDITRETSKKHSIESYALSNLLKHKLAESLNATLEGRVHDQVSKKVRQW